MLTRIACLASVAACDILTRLTSVTPVLLAAPSMFEMEAIAVVGSKDKASFVSQQYGLPLSQIIVRPWRSSKWARVLREALADLRCPTTPSF